MWWVCGAVLGGSAHTELALGGGFAALWLWVVGLRRCARHRVANRIVGASARTELQIAL